MSDGAPFTTVPSKKKNKNKRTKKTKTDEGHHSINGLNSVAELAAALPIATNSSEPAPNGHSTSQQARNAFALDMPPAQGPPTSMAPNHSSQRNGTSQSNGQPRGHGQGDSRNASRSGNHTPVVTTQYFRIRGSYSADFVITKNQLIWNMVKLVTTTTGPRRQTERTMLNDPNKHNFSTFFEELFESEQIAFMKGKFIQFFVDRESVEARKGAFPAENVSKQLTKLPAVFFDLIENVLIYLPAGSSTGPTNLDKNVQTTEQYKAKGTRESTVARAYPFQTSFVSLLQDLPCLKRLDIVIRLDAALKFESRKDVNFDLFNPALPFFELSEKEEHPFKWHFRWESPEYQPEFLPYFLQDAMKRKFYKYRQIDEKALGNIFTVKTSDDPAIRTWKKADEK